MKKALVFVAVALVTTLLYVFADSTSFDYYKQKSSSELHALIFTESDNLYPALDVLNDLGEGAIIVVNNSTNEVYIIEESVGAWDFEVYIEQGQTPTFREKFYPTNCGGVWGDDYHIPATQQTAGSTIKLSEIIANCRLRAETYTYAQKKDALSKYVTNIRNAYKALPEYSTLPDNAITLSEAAPVTTIIALAPQTFVKNETKELGVSFKAPKQLPQGFSVFIAKDKAVYPDNVQSQIDHMKTATDWENASIELLYTKTFNYPKDYAISEKITDTAKIDLLKAKAPEKYLVIITPSDNKKDILGGVFLTISEKPVGPSVSQECSTCSTIAVCLACIDKAFVESVFK